MRAIFSTFDHFMIMFVTAMGVVWGTVFMPLLGGPLHDYEARAIGVGWQSLRNGEAANLREAMEIAASIPVDAVFPSAHAEPNVQLVADVEPAIPDLLGGPEPGFIVAAETTRRPVPRAAPSAPEPLPQAPLADFDPIADLPCDVAPHTCPPPSNDASVA